MAWSLSVKWNFAPTTPWPPQGGHDHTYIFTVPKLKKPVTLIEKNLFETISILFAIYVYMCDSIPLAILDYLQKVKNIKPYFSRLV